ncbi:hypothetical protein SAMN05216436_103141 [bacterium A37T11]|nr:hypothetical protein SAMN05216436_103141 [bacterium A37T11]
MNTFLRFVAAGALTIICTANLKGQVLTPEDSLSSGLVRRDQSTVLSGYGEAKYGLDTKRQSSVAQLTRVVLFVGHKFNNKISLFTEMELENALVASSGSDESTTGGRGDISMEQAFLKFNFTPNTYLVAGLFIPRIGFINENHLPTTFNGVDRPFLETQVIPSVWREIGVGLFGQFRDVPGLNYSLSLTNGLNSANFSSSSGIGGGRQLGQTTNGVNLAVSGSLLYYINNFRIQASGYFGGTTAAEKRVADSLQLNAGPFGNPVSLGEFNVEYHLGAWDARAIGTYIHVSNAKDINRAYANNTPQELYGAYGELAYDILYGRYRKQKTFNIFFRYEWMDLSAKTPSNGIDNPANRKQYLVGGFTYKPIRGVAIKADYVQRITGEFNQALIVTPFPQQVPYFKNDGFVDLGVAYNF